MTQMPHIVLTATDAALDAAWREHCSAFAFVTIERRSILDVDADAIVSPANSFGFMDGGIDLVYSEYFGWSLQHAVQERIRTAHHGELTVGCADIVETGHPRFPYLVVAPTMRVPSALTNSTNPYLAARAVLLLLRYGTFESEPHRGEAIASRIQCVAFPGLGTGVGEMSPTICARQMRAAIESVLIGSIPFPRSWVQAQERNYELVRP